MAELKQPKLAPESNEPQSEPNEKTLDWWPSIAGVERIILQILRQEPNQPLTSEEIDSYCQQRLMSTPKVSKSAIDNPVIIGRLFDLIADARATLAHRKKVQKTPQGWYLFGHKVIDLTSDKTAWLIEAGENPNGLIITRKFSNNGAGPVIVKIDLHPQRPQPEWVNQANCQGYDSQLFFPDRVRLAEEFSIESICFNCPVRVDCLEDALAFPHLVGGYWGGVSHTRVRLLARERRRRLGK